MSRVRRGNKRLLRRKKILRQAKGYWGTKSKLHKAAKQQVLKSLAYAYRDRRQKKRQFRRLWIIRIAAAARQHGCSYSRLIHGLNKAGVSLTEKCLRIWRCVIRRPSRKLCGRPKRRSPPTISPPLKRINEGHEILPGQSSSFVGRVLSRPGARFWSRRAL